MESKKLIKDAVLVHLNGGESGWDTLFSYYRNPVKASNTRTQNFPFEANLKLKLIYANNYRS